MVSSVETKGECDNLLATKESSGRFLMLSPFFLDQFNLATTGQRINVSPRDQQFLTLL